MKGRALSVSKRDAYLRYIDLPERHGVRLSSQRISILVIDRGSRTIVKYGLEARKPPFGREIALRPIKIILSVHARSSPPEADP